MSVAAAGLILAASGLAGTGGAGASVRPGAGVPLPADGMLNGLAATSAGDVWAVGQTSEGDPLIRRGNGASWHRLPPETRPAGTFGLLYAVTATSARNAWAAGFDRMLHWNGTSWTGVRVPHDPFLWSVAIVSAKDVWAVGSAGTGQAVIVNWDGIKPAGSPTRPSSCTGTASPGK